MDDAHFNRSLKEILDLLDEGILVFDREASLLFSSNPAAVMLGLPRGKKRYVGAEELFKVNNPDLYGIISRAASEGTDGAALVVNYRRGKRELKLRVRIIPEKRGFIFILVQDITQIWKLHRKDQTQSRQIQRQYSNLIESLRQIADSVAHELRNPIVSIGGFTNLLLRKCDKREIDIDDLRKFLNYIKEDSERLNKIVAGVELYSDISEVHFSREDIVPLIKEILKEAHRLARRGKHALHQGEVQAKEYLIWHDREKLRSALLDIIRQSVSISLAGTPYVLGVTFTPFDITIIIEFRTERIKEEDLHFIFDPFYNGQGGDINLSVAHRIIVLHGGLIRASRDASGNLILRITIPKEKRLIRT